MPPIILGMSRIIVVIKYLSILLAVLWLLGLAVLWLLGKWRVHSLRQSLAKIDRQKKELEEELAKRLGQKKELNEEEKQFLERVEVLRTRMGSMKLTQAAALQKLLPAPYSSAMHKDKGDLTEEKVLELLQHNDWDPSGNKAYKDQFTILLGEYSEQAWRPELGHERLIVLKST